MPPDHDARRVALDEAECRRLLATAGLGRLGFTDGALPAITPVAFALREDSALIRARHDDTMMSAVRGAVVALQVDSYRDAVGAGWSVTVVGPARVIHHPGDEAEIEALGLFPPDMTTLGCYVTVQLALLRGWRSGHPDPMARARP